jgi:DNA-binding IclR family transcriptional regulator
MGASTAIEEPLGGELLNDYPAPTVAKTMAVIEALGQCGLGLTQAEVVERTGCSANLVYRVLSTLTSLGYITRREDDRRYVLTNRLAECCRPRMTERSLVLCAHGPMTWLRDQSRETVQLVIEVGGKGLVLEQLSGLEAVQVMGRVGMRVPLYSCAPGKAILAFMAAEQMQAWFASTKLKSFTSNTKVTREDLLREFEKIRQVGFAEDWEEGIEGIRCVAAPILDVYQRPAGALTVMSPVKRLPQKRFAELGQWCREAAVRTREALLA